MRQSSAIITGSGAVTFSGPWTASFSIAKRNSSATSSRWIQGHHCRPLPSGPPRKLRKTETVDASGRPSLSAGRPIDPQSGVARWLTSNRHATDGAAWEFGRHRLESSQSFPVAARQ